MKNDHDAIAQTLISLISAKEFDGKEFILFRVRINGAKKNVIYARQGSDEDFYVVDMRDEECKDFFDMLCDNGVSPEHLRDVIDDAHREQYL